MLNIPQLWVGNFGVQALGWGDTTMPAVVWFTTLVLFGRCGILEPFRGAATLAPSLQWSSLGLRW